MSGVVLKPLGVDNLRQRRILGRACLFAGKALGLLKRMQGDGESVAVLLSEPLLDSSA